MIIDNFRFPNQRGIELSGRIYRSSDDQKYGLIFSHGLFSSKDGYKITKLADTIVNSGFALMTFDFTFSGESQGNIADISVNDEVQDLKYAIGIFKNKGIEKIHLMGSSMGAAVTILAASEMETDFESLILIAAPLSFTSLVPEIKTNDLEKLNPDGYTLISGVNVNNRFIKEIFKIDMNSAVKKINNPVLVFHGKLDAVVDFKNFETFIDICNAECSPVVIEDGDHNLTRDSDIKIISDKLREWLGKFTL